MNSTLKDYLFLHFLVVILGFTAILGRFIEINPVALVFFRTAIASSAIALILFIKKDSFRVPSGLLVKLCLAGVILAFHWVCFFGSARLATISVSLVTFSTTSFFTSIVEPLGTGKRISRREVILGGLAIFGIILIFNFESQYYLGILVGLLGALLVAIYSTSNVIMTHKLPSRLINFYQLLAASFCLLVCYPFFLAMDWIEIDSTFPTSAGWMWLFILGTICTVFPHIAIVTLLRRFSAFTINLSLNMEPIYGIGLALLFFGETEHMSVGFYFGSALILLSVGLHAYWDRQKKALKVEPEGLSK